MRLLKSIWQRFGLYVTIILLVMAAVTMFTFYRSKSTYQNAKSTDLTLQQTYQTNKTKIANNKQVLALDDANANASLSDITVKVDKLMSLLSTTKNVINDSAQSQTRKAGLKNYFVLKDGNVPNSLLHLGTTGTYQTFIGTSRGQKIPVIVTGTHQNNIDTFYQLRLTYDVVAKKFVGATQDQYRGGGVSAEN